MSILAVGDISFRGRRESNPDLLPFEQVRHLFNQHNLVVANLESPLVTDDAIPAEGKCTLHGSSGWADVLKECGIGLVSIANNHLMDYGVKGLKSTLQALDDAGIVHVGAGMDMGTACEPAYVKVGDKKVAFLGRSSVVVSSPCYATADRPGVAWFDEDDVLASIKQCRSQADFVVILLHWGIEHYQYPAPSQRAISAKLLSAGADLILGHHPHVVQGEERIGSSVVSYSSGNFLFDEFPWSFLAADGSERRAQATLSEKNRQGLMLEISFDKNGRTITKHQFSRIADDARVVRDETPKRDREYATLCSRLQWPGYGSWWKLYSLKKEWELRFRHQYSPAVVLRKIHKLRPRHVRELVLKLTRSSRISAGKSTNPYE